MAIVVVTADTHPGTAIDPWILTTNSELAYRYFQNHDRTITTPTTIAAAADTTDLKESFEARPVILLDDDDAVDDDGGNGAGGDDDDIRFVYVDDFNGAGGGAGTDATDDGECIEEGTKGEGSKIMKEEDIFSFFVSC